MVGLGLDGTDVSQTFEKLSKLTKKNKIIRI